MKSKFFIRSVLVAATLVLMVSGCDRKDGSIVKPKRLQAPVPVADQQTKLLFSESIPLQRVEVATEALAIWRHYSEQKPTLLLLSNDPMLIPVPESQRTDVAALISNGVQAEIAEQGTLLRPDPLLLPEMTVDAALRSGWFGEMLWALPVRDAEMLLSPETFRQQLQESGVADAAELASVSMAGKQLNGLLRGTPLVAAALINLPEIKGGVIVHFEQSYFQKSYKNEIATPIFPLLFETVKALRERKLQVLAVTFDYGNLDRSIALDVRFVGEILQTLVEKPEMLEQPLSKSWKLFGDLLYLDNFFQKEKKLELALKMEKVAPASAWVKYSLYRSAAENGMGTAALGFLAEAVALDKVYALEYLALSDRALEKKRPDEGLRMLQLVREVFPDNFQITLQLAQLAADRGEIETTRQLVEPLLKLSWSKIYYPDMSEALNRFITDLEREASTSRPSGQGGRQSE